MKLFEFLEYISPYQMIKLFDSDYIELTESIYKEDLNKKFLDKEIVDSDLCKNTLIIILKK